MVSFLERMASAEVARVRAEIAEAHRRRDRAHAAATHVRRELAALRTLAASAATEVGPAGATDVSPAVGNSSKRFVLGTAVRIVGFAGRVDGQKGTIIGKVARRIFFFFKVRIETGDALGESWHVPADSVEHWEDDGQPESQLMDPVHLSEECDTVDTAGLLCMHPGPTVAAVLSPSGRRFRSCLSLQVGNVPCEVWPLVQSGVARVRVPDALLTALRADMATAAINGRRPMAHGTGTPTTRQSAARSGQSRNEFRGGVGQVNIDAINDGFRALLLEISNLLTSALLGSSQFRCEVDSVWGVVQRAGDYSPHQTQRNSKSPFGFSCFVDVELPPQLTLENHLRCPKGSHGHHDGVHHLVWKADRSTDPESLILPGILPCEFMTGYLYVFPQWINVSTFPFDGEGDRKWIAANIAVTDIEPEPESHGAAPPLMSTWVL